MRDDGLIRVGRRLSVAGAGLLALSLLLTWSHQLPPIERARFPGPALFGIPAAPNAFQVYASVGELFAVLSVGITAAGLRGRPGAVAVALTGTLIALAFTVRAILHAPTNGLLLALGRGGGAHYVSDPATPGSGETVALCGLVLAVAGLALIGTAIRARRDPRHAARA
ncbi:hypothetical protein [Conexibacter sp. DBS9H8]|uniref:hypothetical protein n=1 Tax=Conexibacter sp. DBS9H8 TaxID=2937801 RepID=UPI00200C0B27|nr:hypothetical protein [Conexibacter sp. DBS9H8]